MNADMHAPHARDCPNEEDLRDFGRGDLALARLEAIAAHLERCADCSARVGQAQEPTSSLVAGLRRPAGPEPYLNEPECAQLAVRARAIPREPAAARPAPAPPPRLGQYELLEPIGQGGMGAVYRARHTLLGRVVALKILPEGRLAGAQMVARFLREIKALGALEHPHIIHATDAGEADGHPFLVMEYVDGLDLARVVRAVGPLAVADACEAARQAALGLQYAHERGLVHRDVKPSNLMLTPDGQVKVLDLGLALLCGEAASELTASGQFMGTPRFVAPEQARAAHEVDIRADVYSLGCALHKLLTGEAPPAAGPFGGPDTGAPAAAGPDVPEGLRAVLARLLAADRAERYAVPAQVSAALAPFARGSDLRRLFRQAWAAAEHGRDPATVDHAAPDTSSEPSRGTTSSSADRDRHTPPSGRPARRRRLWVALAAALGLTAALGVALLAPSCSPPIVPLPRAALRPSPLDWPAPSVKPDWRFDPISGDLSVTSEDIFLIGLGRAGENDYTLAVDLSPTLVQVPGGVGVFFGYHDEESGRAVRKKYQTVVLRRDRERGREVWRLERAVTTLRNAGGAGQTRVLCALEVGPGPQGKRLALTFAAGTLTRVTWGGLPLPGLADPAERPPAHTVPSRDYRGLFGTYTAHAAGAYRNVILSPSPR